MAHVWQALRAVPVATLGGSRPHPDRYGHRRSFAAAASCRPAHRPAASQAPCVPDALAAVVKERSGYGRSALRFFSRYPGDPAARGEKARAQRSAPRSGPHGLTAPPQLRSHTVPGTAPPSARRAARATRTPACLPPARFSRAYPPVAAAPLRVDGCHTTRPRALTRGACMRTPYRPGTGLPHGVERRYHPARVWQALRALPVAYAWWQPPASGPVRSPPLLCRSGIFVGQRTGPPRRKLLACRSRSPPHFTSPVWQLPPLPVERLPPRRALSRRTTNRSFSRTTNNL